MGLLMIAVAISALPHGCDLLWGNAPMALYGKVVDQMGNPVRGAVVSFEAMARRRVQLPILFYQGREKTWRIQATSGEDGAFAIHDGWGRYLHLKSLEKTGYSQGCVFPAMYYGRNSPEPEYRPDPSHPVEFMSWNDAFKRILARNVVASFVDQQWQTVAYRSGRVSRFGTGDENLECRLIQQSGKEAFGWALEVDGFHGDVAPASGPLGSRAPEKGYAHSLRFDDWKVDALSARTLAARLYSQGPDFGPSTMGKVFASVEITVKLEAGNGPMANIHYVANFGNSRDLVPGPVNPSKP